MTTEKRDYSKLRPFDFEAARDRGEYVCFYNDAQTAKYIGQSSQDECLVCVQWMETKTGHAEGKFAMLSSDNLRMAPLAWVRASADDDTLLPVYKGDTVWNLNGDKSAILVSYFENDMLHGIDPAEKCPSCSFPTQLTWAPPPVKRKIKLVAFINDHGYLRLVREELFANRGLRVPLEDRVVEVEEPAGQEGGAQ